MSTATTQQTTAPRYARAAGPSHFGADARAAVAAYFKETGISPKADARLVPKVIVLAALYLAPLVLMLVFPVPLWAAALAAVVMGIGLAGIGMGVMHDGLHGASSSRGWVNDVLGGSMYLLGSDVYTWKVLHNKNHHTHTNMLPVDQDVDPPAVLRFSEHAPLRPVHRLQHFHAFFFYGLLTMAKLVNDFFTLNGIARSGDEQYKGTRKHRALALMVFVKMVHAAMFIGLPIIFTSYAWWQVVLGFLLMHFTAGFIMGVVFQLAHVVEGAQHPKPGADGTVPHDWAVHELLTTADFAPRQSLITWYTGGLNYQIEHHLFPWVSHLHYPDLAPIVQRVAEQHGLPYNVKPTFGEAFRSHVRKLKELGRVPPAP